jgi:hypothetical protein
MKGRFVAVYRKRRSYKPEPGGRVIPKAALSTLVVNYHSKSTANENLPPTDQYRNENLQQIYESVGDTLDLTHNYGFEL